MHMHLFRLNNTPSSLCEQNSTMLADSLRFWTVGPLGLSISIISLLENFLLFYVFSTSRKLRRQNYVNPVLLAFFDILVSLGYLLISQVHLAAFKLSSASLVQVWAHYMPVVYCLQQSVLTICNFLLVVASLERFLANCSQRTRCLLVFVVRNKTLMIAFIILLAFSLKATLYFDIAVVDLPFCSLEMHRLVPVWLPSREAPFWSAFRFWLRVILTVIVPFIVLAYFNANIVKQLHRKQRRMNTLLADSTRSSPAPPINGAVAPCQKPPPPPQLLNLTTLSRLKIEKKGPRRLPVFVTMRQVCEVRRRSLARLRPSTTGDDEEGGLRDSSGELSIHSKVFESMAKMNSHGIRVATQTLVMVVGCYLISNSLGTAIQILEFFDAGFLKQRYEYEYVLASDFAGLLTILGCALRLPIYAVNDRRIRKALFRAVIRRLHYCRCCFCGSKRNFDEVDEKFLEKWSIQIVSNSLRSNLTGILSQIDWATFDGKRSFDQLALLVQNRKRFLVEMTIKLGTVKEIRNDRDEQTYLEKEVDSC